jgi:hypothetical protein
MNSPFLPEADSPPEEPTPWGFRITLVTVTVYLLYRVGQGLVCGYQWIAGNGWCG